MAVSKSNGFSNIKVKTGTHTRLKVYAVTKGVPLQVLVDKALNDWLNNLSPANPADQAEELRSIMAGS